MTKPILTPKAEATRRHILDTGTVLVARKGFSAIGLQEILREADVPKGSFYHYFPSKEAFGTVLLEHYVEAYSTRLGTFLARPGTGRERMMRYWQAWISDPDAADQPGWAEGCLVVKLSAEVADLSEEMRLVLASGVQRLIDRTAALIRDGRSDGSLPPGADAGALAQALYQMWLGAALVTKLTRTTDPMTKALAATEHLLACAAGQDIERTAS